MMYLETSLSEIKTLNGPILKNQVISDCTLIGTSQNCMASIAERRPTDRL